MPAQHQSLRLLGRQGAPVIGEIHSFDGYTSELLCALLRAMQGKAVCVPVLLTTLPTARTPVNGSDRARNWIGNRTATR